MRFIKITPTAMAAAVGSLLRSSSQDSARTQAAYLQQLRVASYFRAIGRSGQQFVRGTGWPSASGSGYCCKGPGSTGSRG